MKKTWFIAVSIAAMVAACGGGDDEPGTPPPTTSVPASASASVAGMLAYLKLLVVASADAFDPVDVSTVTLPMTDADLPDPVE